MDSSTTSSNEIIHVRMPSTPLAKRRKTTRACDNCRAQKKRCTGTIPCTSCVRNSKTCTFLASYTRGRPTTPPPSRESVATSLTPSSYAQPFRKTISPSVVDKSLDLHSRPPSRVLSGQSPQLADGQSLVRSDKTWTGADEDLRSTINKALPDTSSEHGSDETPVDVQFVGPGSVHSWLKQAWSCLGRVRQHVYQLHSTSAAPEFYTRFDCPIFSHGDRQVGDDLPDDRLVSNLSASTIALLVSTYSDRALATYRFLHQPTVSAWLEIFRAQGNDTTLPAVRSAIVLLILALGSAYLSKAEKAGLSAADARTLHDEVLFKLAMQKLSEERGSPSVESVQARSLQVHYLLTSARPNSSWYAFGTVVQLAFAIGLHRKSYPKANSPGLVRELRRRTFWSVYKLDKSLSISLGRPSLIREECITQELPEIVNDEQVFADHIGPANDDDDCLMEADVAQIKLHQIIGRSMREYYENDDDTLIQRIASNNERLAEWKSQLPPFLSGAVKPSSLIPTLQRQATILNLFHLHTLIFINRPLLLKSFSDTWNLHQDHQIRSNIESCIKAASEVAKQAVRYNLEGQAFNAFWFSQNMTFNAASIIYLNSLRLLQASSSLTDAEHELLSLAEDAQRSLANASGRNAHRYDIVLEQLRLEVRAHLNHGDATNNQGQALTGDSDARRLFETYGTHNNEQIDWTNQILDETSLQDASMFWPQFDGLPLGFDDWPGPGFGEPVTG